MKTRLRGYTCRLFEIFPYDLIMHVPSQGGGTPKLQEGDAVLVARSWFNTGEKLTVARIAQEFMTMV